MPPRRRVDVGAVRHAAHAAVERTSAQVEALGSAAAVGRAAGFPLTTVVAALDVDAEDALILNTLYS
jgi:hypothetical protein